jgi:hypothetical protein
MVILRHLFEQRGGIHRPRLAAAIRAENGDYEVLAIAADEACIAVFGVGHLTTLSTP